MKRSVTTAILSLTVCLITIFHKVKSCREPFSDYDGSCYYAEQSVLNWLDADKYCKDQQSTLVSIHSTDEVRNLQTLIRRTGRKWNTWWIGLFSLDSNGSFQWTDKTAVDFTHFDKNEPNSVDDNENCVTMHKDNGLWNDDHCEKGYYFICKYTDEAPAPSTILPTQDPTIGNCRKGWIPHIDRCYYVGGKKEDERLNWTEAMDFCSEKGGYLTSIRDPKDQDFLAYLLQIIGEDTWIGFNASYPLFRYAWLDNSDNDYTNWGGYTSGNEKNCVKMVYKHVNSGVWIKDECDRKLGFICHARKDPSLKPVHSTYDLDIKCVQPEGWLKLNNMCFQLFDESPLTWDKAEHFCNKQGGHLVSVSDSSVKAVVLYLTRQIKQPFFIGLKYDKKNQNFKWVNNFPLTISMWGNNEPSSFTKDTCFASTSDGYWEKAECGQKLPYICQITTDKPKLKKYVGYCPCSSMKWIAGNNSYCYLQEDKRNYFQARSKCLDYGSNLISLHSMEETEEIRKLIKPETSSIFLGLEPIKKGGYRWADGSPVNFVNWDKGEPLNANGGCVYMKPCNMKWSRTACSNSHAFLCMDLKSTLVEEEIETEEFFHGKEKNSVPGILFGILLFIGLISVLIYIIKIRKRSDPNDSSPAPRKDFAERVGCKKFGTLFSNIRIF